MEVFTDYTCSYRQLATLACSALSVYFGLRKFTKLCYFCKPWYSYCTTILNLNFFVKY